LPAAEFVARIAEAAAEAVGPGVRLTVNAAEDRIPNERAFPLALIVNELVGNAARHGARGHGAVRVDFHRDGEAMVLAVSDDGPGFGGVSPLDEGLRSSGLSLVRGLCSQIGAHLSFDEQPTGLTVVVRFSSEREGTTS
jgi:two-component sensor histidine kinase